VTLPRLCLAGQRPRNLGRVFGAEDRRALQDELIFRARADPGVDAAALVGSSATEETDRWSDIDLAMATSVERAQAETVARWTGRMYGEHGAVHHLDIVSGNALYRVFLLANTLQVDLSFWPSDDFRALGDRFRLLFGAARPSEAEELPTASELVGMGWLYALHARSSIARGRVWQAEYMVSGLRDQALALACLRQRLPVFEGRGMDRLPAETRSSILPALVRSLDRPELQRALEAAGDALLAEAQQIDPSLASRVGRTVRALTSAAP
jgi:predicted nucleotidyltransferase